MTRNDTMLMLLAAVLVVVAWYVRRELRTYAVPGVGRVLRQTDADEAARWKRHYDRLAGEEGQP